MIKTILAIFSLCLLTIPTKATDICHAAKDSAKSLYTNKKEMAFYQQSKNNSNLYNLITITKAFYHKKPVRIANSAKDTSKLSKNEILRELYEKSADKTYPLDTSIEFKKCFNTAFQAKLDSVFKCDFFAKSDSILQAYDKAGKGYSGVDFPGGAGELQKFFNKNLELPNTAAPDDSTRTIRVFYSFFVDEKGKLSNFELVKSNCKVCEELVLETIKKMPDFIPAKDGGKAKKSKYILPYTKVFKLTTKPPVKKQ